jgi:hypothetical protein
MKNQKNTSTQTTKKINRLQFNANMEAAESDFERFEAEFIPADDFFEVESSVEEELKAVWDGVRQVAVSGFAKHGRGYVAIFPNAKGGNSYSSEMLHKSCLQNAEVMYITPGSSKDYFYGANLPDYDAETEVVFAIDFSDGKVLGVTGFGKTLF